MGYIKILYHAWHEQTFFLESSSHSYGEKENGCSKEQITKILEQKTMETDAKILRVALFTPHGIKEIKDFPLLMEEELWRGTWRDAQASVQSAIQLKNYGLQKGIRPNLDCADFRCALPSVRTPENQPFIYWGCPKIHSANDPYYPYKISISWEERRVELIKERSSEECIDERAIDEKILLPRLAERLHEIRGTKTQANAKFECWKADIERRLEIWNPF